MATITNLNQTSPNQLRRIIEDNGITIKKTTSTRYEVVCPSCDKPKAYIYFNHGNRVIECNRKKNCNFSQSLWEYIASRHGYSNKEMTKYINQLLGYEFNDFANELVGSLINTNNIHKEQKAIETLEKVTTDKPIRTQEGIAEEQEFFKTCHQIFTDCLQEHDNQQVAYSLKYLKDDRGYNDAQIKSFNLGFFPDLDKFISLLVKAGYLKDKAEKLINQYFLGVIKINNYQKTEESKNRITFTWFDNKNNIIGFSVRKPTVNKAASYRYLNNTGLSKADHLFNLTKEAKGKNIVIVEGQLDALAGTYFTSSQEGIKNYHFVAIGGNNISQNQVASLKALNCNRVILFLDNDAAGENGTSQSAEKLIAAGITPYIANIPKESKYKDIDELIRKYKDDIDGEYPDLKEILDTATKCEIAVNPDKPVKETQMEQIKEEKPKLDPELQELINQIKSDGVEYDRQTEKTKVIPLDILDYAKRINEIRTRIVKENIGSDRKKDPNFIALNSIYSDIREYNKLLTTDENEDKPYTFGQFFEELAKNTNNGLKTGFKDLNKDITIQPSSLAFIAGRPSHGKTTMMLNILRNMLEDKNNEDKAFLFYSYEETRSDILIKIILSVANDSGLEKKLERDGVDGVNLRQKALNNFKNHPLCIRENNQGEKTALNSKLENAYKKVEAWIEDGRLEILTPKSTAESLSTAIIERCTTFQKEKQSKEASKEEEPNDQEQQTKQREVKKEVAAVFIDYVQKLTTEEDSVNRQQEIQKVCETLLLTALYPTVKTSIILGAQVNRNVVSFDTLTLDNMREAGDIENAANLVLGIWNEQAGEIDWLLAKLGELKEKEKMGKLGLDDLGGKKVDLSKVDKALEKITNKIKETQENAVKSIKIKVLKNRNGQNNGIFELDGHLDRYFIGDKVDKNSDRRITMQERSRHVST